MYQLILLHSCDYLNKNSMKINMVTEEGNSRNEMWHWANEEIGVAVQSWLWVRVELMAWQLSQLEHLNRIQWSWVQSHSGQLSIATSKNHSVVNTICINSFRYNVISCVRLCLKQMWWLTKAKTEMKREHWTKRWKRWNWSSCTKLALTGTWTHGLIAHLVRVSERNSVVVGSNPTEANFL